MKKIKQVSYKDAEFLRYENSRVSIFSVKDGEYIISMKTLTDDIQPRAIHRVVKGKAVITTIKVSQEGAFCLVKGLKDILKKDGKI